MNDMYGGWLGLLKWSLANQDDGTTPSEARPINDEDRAFLEKVMKEVRHALRLVIEV